MVKERCLGASAAQMALNTRHLTLHSLLMREALTVGKIALSDHFFSIELTKQEAKSRIEDELASFCVIVEPAKTTFGKVRSRTPR